MNANQIADELENIYWIQGDGKGKPFQQYADFIRQQQAEIEKLKSIVEDTIGQAFYEDDYHKAQAEIEALKEALKNIIVISDRKHDAWDRAKELLKKASEK